MFVVETPTERQKHCSLLIKNEIQALFGMVLCCSYILKHSGKIKIITFFSWQQTLSSPTRHRAGGQLYLVCFSLSLMWIIYEWSKGTFESLCLAPGALQKFIILWHCATKCHSWLCHCPNEQNTLNMAVPGISTDPKKTDLAVSDSFLLLLMGIEAELQET